MKAVIVIDIGTSSVRGILISEHGEFLYTCQESSEPDFIDNIRVQQDVESWEKNINLIFTSINDYIISSAKDCHVEAVSITSQRSSLIILDENDEPLRPAIMWQDKRSAEIISWIKVNEPMVFEKTGSPLNPVYLAPKILWHHAFCPDEAALAKTYLSIADYVAFLMTGKKQTDWTYASRTSLMNIRDKRWDEDLLSLFEVKREDLCQLQPPGSILGQLIGEAYKSLSFYGVDVVSAGGDQQNAALGLGLIEEGDCELNLGTGAYILTVASELPEEFNRDAVFNSYCLADKYVMETNLITCGSLIDWTKRVFFPDLDADAFYQVLDEELEDSLSSVIVHPYFQGRGAPDWNSQASGSIFHLNLSTNRSDIINAVIEGICFEVKVHITLMEEHLGKEVKAIKVAGGLGKNKKIMQKLSNILQKNLLTYGNPEATAIGAFLQARKAKNNKLDLNEIYRTVRENDTLTKFDPQGSITPYEIKEAYNSYRTYYQKLY